MLEGSESGKEPRTTHQAKGRRQGKVQLGYLFTTTESIWSSAQGQEDECRLKEARFGLYNQQGKRK